MRGKANVYRERAMAQLPALQAGVEALCRAMGDGTLTTQILRTDFPWADFHFRRNWRRLYVAQAGRCSLCDGFMLPVCAVVVQPQEDWQITQDHVQPRFHGGGGRGAENILLAHAGCNTAKGHRPPTDDEIRHLQDVYARLAASPKAWP